VIASDSIEIYFGREPGGTGVAIRNLHDSEQRWIDLEYAWRLVRGEWSTSIVEDPANSAYLRDHWDAFLDLLSDANLDGTYAQLDRLKTESSRLSWGVAFKTEPDFAEVYLNGRRMPERTPCCIGITPLDFVDVVFKKEGLPDLVCGKLDLKLNNRVFAKWGRDGQPNEVTISAVPGIPD